MLSRCQMILAILPCRALKHVSLLLNHRLNAESIREGLNTKLDTKGINVNVRFGLKCDLLWTQAKFLKEPRSTGISHTDLLAIGNEPVNTRQA